MRLAQFWSDLEDHFPPAGVRLSFAGRIGQEDLDLLLRLGVFATRGTAERYPCPRPGGEQCPRRVVDLRDGTFDAVCDNTPPECPDECGLSARDVEQLGLDMPTLARAVSRAFEISSRCEAVPGLPHVHRIGSYLPEPRLSYSVYFAACGSPDAYLATFRTLAAMNRSPAFAVAVPTDRHYTDTVERETRAAGTVVLPLSRHIVLAPDGAFASAAPGSAVLSGLGRAHHVSRTAAAEAFARGVFADGERDLSEDEYRAIVDAPARYDFVIDEVTRRVWKKATRKWTSRVSPTYFTVLRSIVGSQLDFDPMESDGSKNPLCENADAPQICRRMRQAFDSKRGKKRTDEWRMLKSVPRDRGRVVYRFDPDAGLKFAILLTLTR